MTEDRKPTVYYGGWLSGDGDADRPALRPGHPTTWGVITRGTIFDGTAYAWHDPLALRVT